MSYIEPELDSHKILSQMLASNEFGTFFGVSSKVLKEVWAGLTSAEGESVTHVSMEIGADNDVYNPVKDVLREINIFDHENKLVSKFNDKILYGPAKIPNYSGGLGVLAGDTLKSYADCHLPALGISLLYRKGYFSQLVDSEAGQIAHATQWRPEETPHLYLLKNPADPQKPLQIEIPFFDRGKQIKVAGNLWMKLEAANDLSYFVPEILLDYSLPSAPEWIRKAAQHLYESRSERAKAIQRRLLGAGVLPVMKALNITSKTIHLNEQHGVAVVLHLIARYLQEKLGDDYMMKSTDQEILETAKLAANWVVYTIHTPVKAGHDRFYRDMYAEIGHPFCNRILELLAEEGENPEFFNFTSLAMKINRAANGVSRMHRLVTQKQFPQYAHKIKAVTNGVHHLTWISTAKAELFDIFPEFKDWRQNPGVFARANDLKNNDKFRTYLEQAWQTDTEKLIDFINQMLIEHRQKMHTTWIDPPNFFSHLKDSERELSPRVMTIGFARRFSTYKRANLVFEDIDRLAGIVKNNNWPVNFVFAGKAHPADEPGKHIIKNIIDTQKKLYEKSDGLIKLIFIPGYDMAIAKMMVAGVHAWLNSPKRPLEASGTSGMKAALNGVPNISTMDGWWVEGYNQGRTGWKFGRECEISNACLSEDLCTLLFTEDSDSFYSLFPRILKTFYDETCRHELIDKCVMNIALNGPVFNTHRMAAEYAKLYKIKLAPEVERRLAAFRKLYDSNRPGNI